MSVNRPTTGLGLAPSDTETRVAAVRERIAHACDRAGRDPADVRVVAVSKTHSRDALRAALQAGVVDFGENRSHELVPKAEAAEAAGLRPVWHFIGHLQRNKVREVMPHVAVLHSLDSARLIDEIAARRPRALEGRSIVHADGPLPCYIEVNVAGEKQKHGVAPDELPALLAAAASCAEIRVSGLMTVAPRADDPEAVRPVFRALRKLARAHGLNGLSMGMSEDYGVAIEEGATVVRIGRAIFGERAT